MDKRRQEDVRASVAKALDELGGDIGEQWTIGRARVTRFVCDRVRAELVDEMLPDEAIVDALVAELRGRFVEITEVDD